MIEYNKHNQRILYWVYLLQIGEEVARHNLTNRIKTNRKHLL